MITASTYALFLLSVLYYNSRNIKDQAVSSAKFESSSEADVSEIILNWMLLMPVERLFLQLHQLCLLLIMIWTHLMTIS